MALSLAAIAICFYGFFTKGFNYGVDFTGGTVLQVKYTKATPIEEVRKTVASLGTEGETVVAIGTAGTEYLITVRTAELEGDADLAHRLVKSVGNGNLSIERSDVVGPKVGKDLKASALRSLFYSILFIMIYIWFRFDIRFAPGATLAMVHDLILMAGFYIFTGREFTIAAVAALLTIAGYSVNDTIVIYDRVREMLHSSGSEVPISNTINRAINLTLSRTIITSALTFLSVVALVIYCTGDLQSFALSMCVGIVVGTYSTIYIASPLSIFTQNLLAKKAGSRR